MWEPRGPELSARSPLHDVHTRLGARFVDFAGWEMPLHYGSVIAEHRAVRTRAGWFDVSHLGRFRWEGAGATAALRWLTCNDVDRIGPGRAQYTLALNEQGGVIDDMIVWRLADESYLVFPNAANHERIMRMFAEFAPGVGIEDLRPSTVALAVQGPEAPTRLAELFGDAPRPFRTWGGAFEGAEVSGAGTGYTGEPGGELVCAPPVAARMVEALIGRGVTPCGLGARDTLRLEAGLPLWGKDLDEDTTPLEAGLEFAVSFTHDFRGRSALEEQIRSGPRKKLVAFTTGGRLIPRSGYRLRAGSAEGRVTSGNFSPMLQAGIGVGYLSPPSEEVLEVEIRGEWVPVRRVELPFFRGGG